MTSQLPTLINGDTFPVWVQLRNQDVRNIPVFALKAERARKVVEYALLEASDAPVDCDLVMALNSGDYGVYVLVAKRTRTAVQTVVYTYWAAFADPKQGGAFQTQHASSIQRGRQAKPRQHTAADCTNG
jgi:hypothetical protein